MKRYLNSSLFILLTLGLLANSAVAETKTIRIGWTGPLTGAAAESGVALKQAAILAMEEWNEKGGIYIKEYNEKVPVEIMFEDCQSKPEVGVSLGEKLITRDKVIMLLSDALHSHVTLAVMELAPKYGIPIMSIAPVSPEIANKVEKDPKRYWSFWKGDISNIAYSVCFFDTYKYLIEQKLFTPKKKTVAFFVEDTDYGRSYVKQIGDLFGQIGWKTATIETVPLGHTDCYPQLTKIKALDPDILFTCFTAVSSGVAAVKQFQELGLKCSHFGIYYPFQPEFHTLAKQVADYLLWAPMNLDPVNVPTHKEYADKIQKRWNAILNWDYAMGYDGANNALDCIERAKSLEPEQIVEALSKLDRRGVLGRYVFDERNHEIKAGAEYLSIPTGQIVGGQSAIIWPPSVATKEYVEPPWVK